MKTTFRWRNLATGFGAMMSEGGTTHHRTMSSEGGTGDHRGRFRPSSQRKPVGNRVSLVSMPVCPENSPVNRAQPKVPCPPPAGRWLHRKDSRLFLCITPHTRKERLRAPGAGDRVLQTRVRRHAPSVRGTEILIRTREMRRLSPAETLAQQPGLVNTTQGHLGGSVGGSVG